MAVFRCKRSGNTITMMNENDIIGLRQHEGYEEVLEQGVDHGMQEKRQEAAPQVRPMVISVAKRGRPRKTK